MIPSDVHCVLSYEHSTSPGVDTVRAKSDHLASADVGIREHESAVRTDDLREILNLIVRAIDSLSGIYLTTCETGHENTANRLQSERQSHPEFRRRRHRH